MNQSVNQSMNQSMNQSSRYFSITFAPLHAATCVIFYLKPCDDVTPAFGEDPVQVMIAHVGAKTMLGHMPDYIADSDTCQTTLQTC